MFNKYFGYWVALSLYGDQTQTDIFNHFSGKYASIRKNSAEDDYGYRPYLPMWARTIIVSV